MAAVRHIADGHAEAKLSLSLFTSAADLFHSRQDSPPSLMIMATLTIPRIAVRSLSRTASSIRSRAPRIAARRVHQSASPITASSLQHRPTVHSSAQASSMPASTVPRRTMFIQTEPTPNPDVGFGIPCAQHHDAKVPRRLSNSTRTSACCPNRYRPRTLNTSPRGRPLLHPIRPRSPRSS